MAALRGSAQSADPQPERRHDLGERYCGWQVLTDPLQVSLRGAKLLGKSLGVSLRASLACFPQFVSGVIAESSGCLRQATNLHLETLKQLKNLRDVLRRGRLRRLSADNHIALCDMAANFDLPDTGSLAQRE